MAVANGDFAVKKLDQRNALCLLHPTLLVDNALFNVCPSLH